MGKRGNLQTNYCIALRREDIDIGLCRDRDLGEESFRKRGL